MSTESVQIVVNVLIVRRVHANYAAPVTADSLRVHRGHDVSTSPRILQDVHFSRTSARSLTARNLQR